jgi:hypothetical protein
LILKHSTCSRVRDGPCSTCYRVREAPCSKKTFTIFSKVERRLCTLCVCVCVCVWQAYYPERLGRLFIVHVPIIFWGAWKLVNPFIDKVTKEKVNQTFIRNCTY